MVAFGSSKLPSTESGLQQPTAISTLYRNTSDAAQMCLPPTQAAMDVIPGFGSVIKGAIGAILGTLQLVDVIQAHSRTVLLATLTSPS